MGYELLFRGARVVDGTGSPWFRADVAVAAGRIRRVAPRIDEPAERTIDVADQVLAPGFWDMHSHSDVMLLANARQECKVFQGVTFELLGQDGLSYAPLSPPLLADVRRHLAGLNGDNPAAGWDWSSVADYLRRFHQRVAVNVGFLVPHNAVRLGAVGWEARLATPAELDRMRGLVAEGMADGAFGLSTGLTYPPNVWSDTDELVALCRVVARSGGIFVTHMRGHGDGLLDPIRESIEIARRAGLPLHISHLKSSRLGSAANLAGVLDLLAAARAGGLDVTFDCYQYGAGSSMLHALLPYWVHAGGPEAEVARLRSGETRARIRAEWAVRPPALDRVRVASVATDRCRWMEGLTLGELVAGSGTDAVGFVCDLLVDQDLAVSHVSEGGAGDDDLAALLRHPAQMMGSDGLLLGGQPHPRAWGTFARVLQRYVREQRLLSLEEAIRKFASFPAQRLGIGDRGLVKEGMWADLAVFDDQAVAERATYQQPRQTASGFSYVAVNGQLVLDAGVHTGATPGRALRRGYHGPRA